MHHGLQPELPSFVSVGEFVLYGKLGKCFVEVVFVDGVFPVEEDPWDRVHRESLELTNRQCFHLNKLPLISELEHRRPLFDIGVVE